MDVGELTELIKAITLLDDEQKKLIKELAIGSVPTDELKTFFLKHKIVIGSSISIEILPHILKTLFE